MLIRISCVFVVCLASYLTNARQFPNDFMFGAGTAAYQIEGGWNEDGRGPCIWDIFVEQRNLSDAKVACDSYHKWQEDVENAKNLGLDTYRFSISWSRILPNGTLNIINQKGIDYYLNLIKALKVAGIEPIITLYHWDLPQYLHLQGGFLNPQLVDYFEDFARLCYQQFGQYVQYWLTINELFQVCYVGYAAGSSAPGLYLEGDGVYQCSYVLLLMHARAYRVYDEEFRNKYNGQVGIVINSEWREPASDSTEDLEAQEQALQFSIGWWANPIFLGNWPQIMIDRIANRSKLEGFTRSRLPEFTEEEINYINGTHDFFAFNTYGTQIVSYQEEDPISYPSYIFDRGVNTSDDILHYALGIRREINFINDRYKPKAILITENGVSQDDQSLEDTERIDFLNSFLNNILDAILLDNVNVISYNVWSLMDNYEWGNYDSNMGIIQVDFSSPNRTRTWKKSASWYQNLATTKTLDPIKSF
ncbi:myrosinase 1-like [Anthonomus grandis grandis]|uniref:myrosinase 1-like n=1 Tax=Anthonomus grandis grandis TaxID=2921223 RepID=UPI002165E569|nr:myrosinase 1-like [Anthonomus grandis grandis]